MNIYGITPERLRDYFSGINENPAKAAIVYDGVYRHGISDFAQLGFAERITKRLQEDFDFALPETVKAYKAPDAAKLLLRLADGECVETVLMRQEYGNLACISTQVGCNMGCAFCKSGTLKKRRNLTSGEMIGQLIALSRELSVRIDGVSVMGIGEPFDNFDSVMDFCGIAAAPKGLEIGRRHITVSTCGLVPRIYDYARHPYRCNLAISLHAPNDALRSRLMPVNSAYGIQQLMAAAGEFSRSVKHRVALEYVLIDGVNDSDDCARELSALVSGGDFLVNIIPYNDADFAFKKSRRLVEFYDILKKHGVNATTRKEFGADIKAACGQLAAGS